MAKRIYVGNLPFSADRKAVEQIFRRIAKPVSIELGHGSAVVELPDERYVPKAIKTLHQTQLGGRTLDVKLARPRQD